MVAVPVRAWTHRHLLDVEGLSRDEIERICDLAVEMRSRSREHARIGPCWRTRSSGSPSTRRRRGRGSASSSPPRRSGPRRSTSPSPTSSVEKGESLVDTVRTLERTGVTILVLRHPAAGCRRAGGPARRGCASSTPVTASTPIPPRRWPMRSLCARRSARSTAVGSSSSGTWRTRGSPARTSGA